MGICQVGSPLHSVVPTGLHLSVSCKQAMNCLPISVLPLQGISVPNVETPWQGVSTLLKSIMYH